MPNKGPTRRAARGRDKLLFKCTELDVTRRYRVLPRVHPLATIHDERTVDCTIKVYNTNIYMYGCVYVCVHKAGMKGVTRLMFHFVNRSRPSTQNARHRRFSRLFQRPRASLKGMIGPKLQASFARRGVNIFLYDISSPARHLNCTLNI